MGADRGEPVGNKIRCRKRGTSEEWNRVQTEGPVGHRIGCS